MGRPDPRLRYEVRKLLKSGRVYRGRLLHVRVGPSDLSTALISVRRKLGTAVLRNRVRRRVRVICQQASLLRPQGRLMLITVSDFAGRASYRDLRNDLQSAFARLNLT